MCRRQRLSLSLRQHSRLATRPSSCSWCLKRLCLAQKLLLLNGVLLLAVSLHTRQQRRIGLMAGLKLAAPSIQSGACHQWIYQWTGRAGLKQMNLVNFVFVFTCIVTKHFIRGAVKTGESATV